MDSRKLTIILLAVATYVVTAGVAYGVFSKTGGSGKTGSSVPATSTSTGVKFDQGLPKTEACPLNGVYYSAQQKKWWEAHRPLGVMIENHVESRPQSGLSLADVVYEAVAEGGITRFLTVFYCQDANPIGPVRSARTYFIDFISEYGDSPLYVHVGGANTPGPADALGQLEDYGWAAHNDMNQFSIGFPTFWRDCCRQTGKEVATEHTMYSTTTKLWDFAKKDRELTNVDEKGTVWNTKFVSYSFKDDAALADRPASQAIHVEFWKGYGEFFVDWNYNKTSNDYSRNNGGVSHIDKDTGKQLTAKNIVMLFMTERSANDGYEGNLHLLYGTKGTGKAFIFMDGKQVIGKWKKDSRTARTLLFDAAGNPIKFDRGQTWFQILPTEAIVTVK